MRRDDAQSLIDAIALSSILLETLEGTSDPIASQELIAGLREFCEHARSRLSAATGN
jgi:hypothetical protein